jgi:hypothetical protein
MVNTANPYTPEIPGEQEIHSFLLKHLQAILANDINTYHATTSAELTLYEWWVTPHRIDGLPFHDFMMTENARLGTVFGEETGGNQKSASRFDLANLKIQCYDKAAIASYTLLISASTPAGVRVAAHNESRVIVKIDNKWQVVHVHKSPAWNAPHLQL